MPTLQDEKLTEAEARLHQVGISDIERLTGLTFGELGESEVRESDEVRLREIHDVSDIRVR